MQVLVLSDEQKNVVAGSSEPVDVRDANGQLVAVLHPLDPIDAEVLEKHRQNRGKPKGKTFTVEEVRAHLQRLAEIEAEEGLDKDKMLALLKRMQAGENV